MFSMFDAYVLTGLAIATITGKDTFSKRIMAKPLEGIFGHLEQNTSSMAAELSKHFMIRHFRAFLSLLRDLAAPQLYFL